MPGSLLGFQAEIGGKAIDVAPLIAAFLQQYREGFLDHLPDVVGPGPALSPASPFTLTMASRAMSRWTSARLRLCSHMFLSHHVELGAMHPSDAGLVRLAEEALAGSDVRFSDRAGILPLARSIHALTQVETFSSPAGLRAQLRDYQAYGSAWMAALLQAGFGGVLADDMGLGKTVQTLALLQARREAEVQGPVLLIVPTQPCADTWRRSSRTIRRPTCIWWSWHGNDRATYRLAALQADLVVTTYPLLARDREWLAAHDWPLVILDEAQTLKNPASQMAKTLREIPAKGRLALTGTPLETRFRISGRSWIGSTRGSSEIASSFKHFSEHPLKNMEMPARKHASIDACGCPCCVGPRNRSQQNCHPRPRYSSWWNCPSRSRHSMRQCAVSVDARVREAISTKGLAASRITVLDALLKLRQVCW